MVAAVKSMKTFKIYSISFLLGYFWYSLDFLIEYFLIEYLDGKTMNTYVSLLIFSVIDLFLGGVVGITLKKYFSKLIVYTAIWFVMFSVVEEMFFVNYWFFDSIGLFEIFVVIGDTLASVIGFSIGIVMAILADRYFKALDR